MKQDNLFTKIQQAFLNLNAYEFTLLATLIGFVISEGLDYNQQQSLGNFFEMIGQTALTIGQQNQTINNTSSIDYSSIIELLKNKIGNLEELVTEIKNLKL